MPKSHRDRFAVLVLAAEGLPAGQGTLGSSLAVCVLLKELRGIPTGAGREVSKLQGPQPL